jgi:hypothetical protein
VAPPLLVLGVVSPQRPLVRLRPPLVFPRQVVEVMRVLPPEVEHLVPLSSY